MILPSSPRRGARLEPTNFTVSMREAAAGGAAGGRIRIRSPAAAAVARARGIPAVACALAQPILRVSRLAGRWRTATCDGKDRPTRPPPSRRAPSSPNLGIVAQDAFPGASGLSGSFDATEKGGEIKLATRNATLELPRVFAGPIPLDALQGALQLGPHGRPDARRHPAPRVHECACRRQCQRHLSHGGAGARRNRPDRAALARAIRARCTAICRMSRTRPRATWLRRASDQRGGDRRAPQARRRSRAVSRLPTARAGQFIVTAQGDEASRSISPITGRRSKAIDGEMRFEGASMTIDAARGRVFGAQIGRTRAAIADLRAAPPRLTIEGSATGSMPRFPALRRGEPGRCDHRPHHAGRRRCRQRGCWLSTSTCRSAGAKAASIGGEFTFVNTQLKLPGVPRLSQLNGKFAFSNGDMSAREITAEVAGGPAKFAVGTVGRAHPADGRRHRESRVAPARIRVPARGATDRGSPTGRRWPTCAPSARHSCSKARSRAPSIDLPAPLGKVAGESDSAAHRNARGQRPAGRGYGRSLLRPRAARRWPIASSRAATCGSIARSWCSAAPRRVPKRRVPSAPASGCAATCRCSTSTTGLRLRDRDRASAGTASAGDDDDVALARRRPRYRRARGVRPPLQRFQGRPRAARSRIGSSSCAAAISPARPLGRRPSGDCAEWTNRCAAVALRDAWQRATCRHGAARKSRRRRRQRRGPIERWPELDIAADSFVSKGRDLGQLERRRAAARQRMANREARAVERCREDRRQRRVAQHRQAAADAARGSRLTSKDAGAFLARMGYPDAIKGAPTTHPRSARMGGIADGIRLSDADGCAPADRRGAAASRRSSRGSASCSASCRCSRCRAASRSISRMCSAKDSRSTKSPATSGSPTA